MLAVAQRELVDRRGWLTRLEFVELYAVAQLLPGPNVVNLSLMIGDRYFGLRGALAAISGMLVAPLLVVLALAASYQQLAQYPAVAGALRGMGAVAAGLILAMALKMLGTLRGNVLGPALCTALGLATLTAIAVFRVPLAWVVIGLGLGGWGAGALAHRAARCSDRARRRVSRPMAHPTSRPLRPPRRQAGTPARQTDGRTLELESIR